MSFIVFQVCDSSLWVIDMTKVWRSEFNIKHINSNLYSRFTNLFFFIINLEIQRKKKRPQIESFKGDPNMGMDLL